MRDLVWLTCSSFSCWIALTCSNLHAQALVLFNPYAFLLFFFPLPHSFPLMSVNAFVHNSCAPEVQIVRSVAIFDLPIGLLLAASSPLVLSPIRFCFLAQTVALLLDCRRGFLSRIMASFPELSLGSNRCWGRGCCCCCCCC